MAPHQRNQGRTHPGQPPSAVPRLLGFRPIQESHGAQGRVSPRLHSVHGKGPQASAQAVPSRHTPPPRELGGRGPKAQSFSVPKPGKSRANWGELVTVQQQHLCWSETPFWLVLGAHQGKKAAKACDENSLRNGRASLRQPGRGGHPGLQLLFSRPRGCTQHPAPTRPHRHDLDTRTHTLPFPHRPSH